MTRHIHIALWLALAPIVGAEPIRNMGTTVIASSFDTPEGWPPYAFVLEVGQGLGNAALTLQTPGLFGEPRIALYTYSPEHGLVMVTHNRKIERLLYLGAFDGRHALFSGDDPKTGYTLYITDLDGSYNPVLSANKYTTLPDGEQIAWACTDHVLDRGRVLLAAYTPRDTHCMYIWEDGTFSCIIDDSFRFHGEPIAAYRCGKESLRGNHIGISGQTVRGILVVIHIKLGPSIDLAVEASSDLEEWTQVSRVNVLGIPDRANYRLARP